jgi:MOSC domain-containing protein YiiM
VPARVHQINLSDGGVPKLPVERALIDASGVVGDRQEDTQHHGSPDQALCLFSLEVIERFRHEGHPIEPGFAGENLTISGLDWTLMVPGSRWRVGPAVEVEITGYTSPCYKNAGWFIDGDYTRMLQGRHPGESRVYARVLRHGVVADGDEVVSSQRT